MLFHLLSLVRHFVCFENDHRHGDHVTVGDVTIVFASFKTGILPNCCFDVIKCIC